MYTWIFMKVLKKLSVGNNTYMYNCIYMHGNDIFWKALYYYIIRLQTVHYFTCLCLHEAGCCFRITLWYAVVWHSNIDWQLARVTNKFKSNSLWGKLPTSFWVQTISVSFWQVPIPFFFFYVRGANNYPMVDCL